MKQTFYQQKLMQLIENRLGQMQDIQEELDGMHELFKSQNPQHGSKIVNVSSRHARRKICEAL